MMAQHWKALAKWCWVLAVGSFAAYYVYARFHVIESALSMLSSSVLVFAACSIGAAKVFLAENMRLAVVRVGLCLSFRDCFCIYNVTQLGKYIPGSIWQFVGRIALLREHGVSPIVIRDSMIAEHAWVLLSTLIFSAVFFVPAASNDVRAFIAGLGTYKVPLLTLLLIFLIGGGLAFSFFPVKRLFIWILSLRPSSRVMVTLFVAWALLATSFWITLAPFRGAPVPWLYCIGLYCLAYVAGFLVPFAPAGLGVREAILVMGVASYVGTDIAFVLAGVNRILYFLVEVIMVMVAPCLKIKA